MLGSELYYGTIKNQSNISAIGWSKKLKNIFVDRFVHSYQLKNLKPNTKYYFRIGGDNGKRKEKKETERKSDKRKKEKKRERKKRRENFFPVFFSKKIKQKQKKKQIKKHWSKQTKTEDTKARPPLPAEKSKTENKERWIKG